MTCTDLIKRELLNGNKIDKFKLMRMSKDNSVCLAQRIHELQKDGWNISRRSKKGKGTLREYYLEQEEIERLKAKA